MRGRIRAFTTSSVEQIPLENNSQCVKEGKECLFPNLTQNDGGLTENIAE